MATYKGIQGYTVQKLSDDPTVSEAVGQLWYNSTSGDFKVGTSAAGAWASGGSLNQARTTGVGYGITSDTAGAVGGYRSSPSAGVVANNEQYNGTAWTEVADLPGANGYMGGGGTQTAALSFGGDARPSPATVPNPVVLIWNGSSWTETTEMNSSVAEGYGCGISSSAILSAGGRAAPYPTATAATESWNGSAWTEGGNMLNTAIKRPLMGTITAALANSLPPGSTNTEQYDGTSWTEVGDSNTNHTSGNGVGSTTDALVYSNGSSTVNTETYNGTSWTEVANMASGRATIQGNVQATNSESAIAAGGEGPGGIVGTTEEWTSPIYSIKTVTVS